MGTLEHARPLACASPCILSCVWHVLFQVLLEFGVVTGDTKAEKEAFLEVEFARADEDDSGTVDYEEFITFYKEMRRRK